MATMHASLPNSEMENHPFLTSQAHLIHSIGHELLEEQGFDQMVHLLGGEACGDEFMAFGGVLGDENLCSSAVGQVLGCFSTDYSAINPCFGGQHVVGDADGGTEEKDEDNDDSGVTTTSTKSRPGRDRARTLVSERKRRGRMKERLYELRSLVPNITKMDKASIIGDAIVYIKDLQRQAKSLTEEITRLESSSKAQAFQGPLQEQKPATSDDKTPLGKREILRLTAYETGEQRFHFRMECNRGEGTPEALYKAIEALTFTRLESSSFSTLLQRHEVNFALKVGGYAGEMNASSLKLWVMTALMNEGFELKIGTSL